jgi:hypothetical protein
MSGTAMVGLSGAEPARGNVGVGAVKEMRSWRAGRSLDRVGHRIDAIRPALAAG